MKLSAYRKIAPTINAEIEALFKKHGFKMSKIRASIDEDFGVVRYTIETVDLNLTTADGAPTTPEAENYKQHCKLFGRLPGDQLKEEWLNATFKMGGEEYRLLGMSTGRKAKNIIVLRLRDDSRRITTEDVVVRAFGVKAAA